MRITQSILDRNSLHAISRNFEKIGQLNEQLSSGKRVNTVSDDVLATRDILRFERDNAQLQIFNDNAEGVKATLGFATGNLQHASEALTQTKEIAVQGATGTYSASERAVMAEGIDAHLNSLLSLANTRYQGRYMFGGQETGHPPFQAELNEQGDIGKINYRGTTSTTKVRIGPGIESETSFAGRPIFQGKTDAFATLINLRDALRENDTDAIDEAIGDLDNAQDNITRNLGNLGERTAQMDVMQNSVETMMFMNKRLQSERQDADIAEVAMEYTNMMTLLQTVMKVASSAAQMPSIAHYM